MLQFKLYVVISGIFLQVAYFQLKLSYFCSKMTRVPWLVKNNECSIYFNSRVLFGNLISLDLQFISSSDTKALLIIDVQFIRNNVFQFIVLDCNWCFVLNKMIHNEPSRTMPNMLTCTKFLAYWLFNDLYFLLTLIRYYLLR